MKKFGERRLQMIARTETTRAFNIGTIEEAQSSEVVVGYKFDAVLDRNTSNICRARNGKFIPKSEKELLVQNTPPLHVNCRSRLVPVTRFDELPRRVMPIEWKPEETPKQRPYDLAVLNQIIKTTPAAAPAPAAREPVWALDDVIETLKDMEIPLKDRYKPAEIRRIISAIDPDNPLGTQPPIEHRSVKSYTGMYTWRTQYEGGKKVVAKERLIFNSNGYDLKTVYHETLHRQYIARTGDGWGNCEEGVVDFLAKYMLRKTHPHVRYWRGGSEEEPLKLMLIAMERNGIDDMARFLFSARKKAVPLGDDSLRFLWQGLKLNDDDFKKIASMIRKHKDEFRNVLADFVTRGGKWEMDDALREKLEECMKIAIDPQDLALRHALGFDSARTILHAFQSWLLEMVK